MCMYVCGRISREVGHHTKEGHYFVCECDWMATSTKVNDGCNNIAKYYDVTRYLVRHDQQERIL